MDTSIFLLKFFGIVYALIGLAIILNPRDTAALVERITKPEKTYRLRIVAVMPLVFGLLIVLLHNSWNTLPYALLSLVGWVALLKGAFNLLAPATMAQRVIRASNTAALYTFGGFFAIVLGLYLAAAGFGLL